MPADEQDQPIRVVICDDAVAFSLLVTQWIADCADLEVVAEARSGPALLDMLGSVGCDVVVLDHILGSMDSDQLVPLIRGQQPDVGILLVSGMPPDALAEIAGRAGVSVFASKASRPDDFCDSIREAAKHPGSAPEEVVASI
jgi:two-component system invasion response regulator UvrY